MRLVVIEGIVLNTDAIDMIVPQGKESQVSLRSGVMHTFALSTEELLEHLRHNGDDVLRIEHEAAHDAVNTGPSHVDEESA